MKNKNINCEDDMNNIVDEILNKNDIDNVIDEFLNENDIKKPFYEKYWWLPWIVSFASLGFAIFNLISA